MVTSIFYAEMFYHETMDTKKGVCDTYVDQKAGLDCSGVFYTPDCAATVLSIYVTETI